MSEPDSKHTLTEAEFESLSWHDNHVHGMHFRICDPDAGDWINDLILDIDYIAEWVRDDDRMRFRAAPATLVFHGITDQLIDIDWGDSGFRVAHSAPSIDGIERERIADRQVFFDRHYYHWQIHLNAPSGGRISFGAYGFTQTLRTEPLLCDEQMLSPSRRRTLPPVDTTV